MGQDAEATVDDLALTRLGLRFVSRETEARFREWHAREAMPFMRITYAATLLVAFPGALAALTGPQDCVETMRQAFDRRRVKMVELLRAIPGVSCREPKGAFYAFPDVSAFVGKKTPEGSILDDDVQLCDWLVEVHKVAVVPGSGFGAPGYVRLSYATSMKNIQEGVSRIAKAFATLR